MNKEIFIHKSNCVAKGIDTKEFNNFFKIIDCPYCRSEFASHIKEINIKKNDNKYIECISCHKEIKIN